MFEPKGTQFWDQASGRQMMLVLEGPSSGWIVYKHPDGQWVALREATLDDLRVFSAVIIAAYHSSPLEPLLIKEGGDDDSTKHLGN